MSPMNLIEPIYLRIHLSFPLCDIPLFLFMVIKVGQIKAAEMHRVCVLHHWFFKAMSCIFEGRVKLHYMHAMDVTSL